MTIICCGDCTPPKMSGEAILQKRIIQLDSYASSETNFYVEGTYCSNTPPLLSTYFMNIVDGTSEIFFLLVCQGFPWVGKPGKGKGKPFYLSKHPSRKLSRMLT